MSIAIVLLLAVPAPPNVVFIIGDDQAWTDYGFMGHPHIRTPHLDKLAGESLTFTHGYVPTSLCRASLATMITGRFPHEHKITSNDPPLPGGTPAFLAARKQMAELFTETPALPKLLAPAGYVSHQSGKWWEGNPCRCGGFTEAMTVGDEAKGGRHGDAGLIVGRQGLKEVTTFIDGAVAAKKPFFVWYAPMMPHQPHNPPERLLKKYRDKTPSKFVAGYWAMCEWFDETVGELLAHLDKAGQRENTLVIYLHDNGWIQDPDKPTFAPRSKRSPYDGGVRTPILVRWPGHATPGRSDTAVSSIDLVPTALAAVGVSASLQGVNLLDAKATKADVSYGAIFEHNAIDIRNPAANVQYRWVVAGGWKLIVPNSVRVPNGTVELFAITTDPEERTNLAGKERGKVAELTKRLDGWWPGK